MSKRFVCFFMSTILFLSISNTTLASGGVIYIRGGISEPSCIVNGGDNIECRTMTTLENSTLSIHKFYNKSVTERADILNSDLVKIESISKLQDKNGKSFSTVAYK